MVPKPVISLMKNCGATAERLNDNIICFYSCMMTVSTADVGKGKKEVIADKFEKMWGKETGKWLAEGHTYILLLCGRILDLHRNGIYAILSEGKNDIYNYSFILNERKRLTKRPENRHSHPIYSLSLRVLTCDY